MKKIKLLIVAKNLEINGISIVIMNYCNEIDLSKFDITIMAGECINDFYLEECKRLGINIIKLPNKSKNAKKYYIDMFKKIKKNYYDIIHVHGNSSLLFIDLFIAFLKNIKIRISHCHNTKCKNKFLHKLLLPIFNLFYTTGFACSDTAGKWLYCKKKYRVIPNAFNVEKFKYNEDIRKQIRKKLNLKQNDFLIGHIGRFNNQKNQEFLIPIIKELLKKKKNIFLIFIGNGPNFDNFKNYLIKENLDKNIILYKETNNPEYFYSAIDLFLFPSKYEGFGIVMLEAQINGLNCIASEKVPKDVKITKNVKFLSIENDSYKIWIDEIEKNIKNKKTRNKVNIINKNIQNYNIKKSVKKLEKIYVELVNKKR